MVLWCTSIPALVNIEAHTNLWAVYEVESNSGRCRGRAAMEGAPGPGGWLPMGCVLGGRRVREESESSCYEEVMYGSGVAGERDTTRIIELP